VNHFRLARLVAVAVVAVTATLASGTASAASDHGAAAHYTVAYPVDFTGMTAPGYTGPVFFGFWNCAGVRVTNAQHTRDNFTCTTTATDVTATFSSSIPWPCGCIGWSSDFDGKTATSYEIDIADGVVNAWANY